MKALIFVVALVSSAFSNQYVFLMNKNDTEMEYEAKIISKIASSSLKENIRVYIPNITQAEKKIYSRYVHITQSCESANFVFDNKGRLPIECEKSKKLFFTNNYRRLLTSSKYYGAFFWNKSRPNIVFIKQRLQAHKVDLSSEYNKYIEDISSE